MTLGLLLAAIGMDTVSGQLRMNLRLRSVVARRQLPGRGHRAVRHQRDPADHGERLALRGHSAKISLASS